MHPHMKQSKVYDHSQLAKFKWTDRSGYVLNPILMDHPETSNGQGMLPIHTIQHQNPPLACSKSRDILEDSGQRYTLLHLFLWRYTYLCVPMFHTVFLIGPWKLQHLKVGPKINDSTAHLHKFLAMWVLFLNIFLCKNSGQNVSNCQQKLCYWCYFVIDPSSKVKKSGLGNRMFFSFGEKHWRVP